MLWYLLILKRLFNFFNISSFILFKKLFNILNRDWKSNFQTVRFKTKLIKWWFQSFVHSSFSAFNCVYCLFWLFPFNKNDKEKVSRMVFSMYFISQSKLTYNVIRLDIIYRHMLYFSFYLVMWQVIRMVQLKTSKHRRWNKFILFFQSLEYCFTSYGSKKELILP